MNEGEVMMRQALDLVNDKVECDCMYSSISVLFVRDGLAVYLVDRTRVGECNVLLYPFHGIMECRAHTYLLLRPKRPLTSRELTILNEHRALCVRHVQCTTR